MPEMPQTEESIFAQALEQPNPDVRARFLERACAGNPALRARVENLLQSDSRAGSFLQNPVPLTVDSTIEERPGTLIGPYKLLQQIGEGGMGVVYMAEQQKPVERRVALKIIKPGMDSRQVVARFEAERQALAMLDHQNIARVLDGGATESGRPYFVMELVHGIPITRYCEENRLTPRQRLQLFVPVCQAIQHAHQKGIIHRDVKPSNILVTMYDDKPVPKLIDFGVAKAIEQRLTEKTLFTQFGTLVGTFEYMSPEQAEMNAFGVDTRSDVYSLGVLLYELLTGTTPLERIRLRQAAFHEVVRLIKEEDPPRPSTRLSSSNTLPKFAAACRTEPARLSQLLKGELDWIVMKCLEKDRKRRYETANGLARDVERYLSDQPVEACPPSAVYRASKFIRRNRLAFAAGVVVAASLLVGAIASTWMAVVAAKAQGRAEVAATEAMNNLREVELQKEKALEAQAESDRQRKQAEEARQAEARQRELADERRAEALESSRRARLEQERAESLAEEIRTRLVHSHVDQGQRLAESGDSFGAVPWLVQALKLDVGNPEREAVHRTRLGMFLEQSPKLVQMWALDTGIGQANFSPDGLSVLTLLRPSPHGVEDQHPVKVHIWNAQTGKLVAQIETPGSVPFRAQFSSDGRTVVTAQTRYADSWAPQDELALWDAATGREAGTPVVLEAGRRVFLPFFEGLVISPDGKRAFVRTTKGTGQIDLGIADLESGTWIGRWPIDASRGLSLFPDGSRLMTAAYEREVLVWDLPGNEPESGAAAAETTASSSSAPGQPFDTAGWESAFTAPALRFSSEGHIYGASLSPDGKQVIAYAVRLAPSRLLLLHVWDSETGQPVATHQVAVSEELDSGYHTNGTRIVLIDGLKVEVLDLKSGHSLFTWVAPAGIATRRLSSDGRLLLVCTMDDAVRLWDLKTGRLALPLIRHLDNVMDAQFSPDGSRLLTASVDTTARMWDLGTRDLSTRSLVHAERVIHVAFRPDGRRMATASLEGADGGLVVWDHQSGRVVRRLEHALPPRRADYSPDGRYLVTVAWRLPLQGADPSEVRAEVKVWNAQTEEAERTLCRLNQSILHAAFSPDGRKYVLTTGERWIGGADGEAQVWDLEAGKQLYSLKHVGAARYAEFSPDGRWLATAGDDGTAVLWDAATGERRRTWQLSLPVACATFSPDSTRLATATWDDSFDEDGVARVWDVASGEPVTSPVVHADGVLTVRFSPDGTKIVTASEDHTARVWNSATGAPLTPPMQHTRHVEAAAFSPDGRWILTTSRDGTSRLWEAATGQPISLSLRNPGASWRSSDYRPDCAVFSPDGTSVACANDSRTLGLWRIASDDRPIDDLVEMAGVLSYQSIDSQGGTAPRDVPSLAKAWDMLAARYPEHYSTSGQDLIAWNRRQVATLLAAGRPSDALKHAEFVIGAMPNSGPDYLARARVHSALNEFDSSIADCTKAIEYGGGSDARHERALAWFRMGSYESAIEDVTEAIKADPQNWPAWNLLATSELRLGRYEEMIADCTRAIESRPPVFRLIQQLSFRAEAYRALRRWEESLADAQTVIDLSPRRSTGYSEKGTTLAEMGDWPEARKSFDTALSLFDSGTETYNLAMLGLQMGDVGEYKRRCSDLLARTGNLETAQASNLVAWCCSILPDAVPDPAQALLLAENAVSMQPDAWAFQNTLALAEVRMGRFQAAIDRVTQNGEESVSSPDDWVVLALAYAQLAKQEAGDEQQRAAHVATARGWIDRTTTLEAAQPGSASATVPRSQRSWDQRLTLRLLCEEAQALLANVDAER